MIPRDNKEGNLKQNIKKGDNDVREISSNMFLLMLIATKRK